MAWLSRSLGDSVSSLTGQLSNLTKDILTEGTEEVSDHATELSLAKEQIANLESIQTAQRIENERLKAVNRELEEKAEASELQINSISREYRSLLEEKEKEIKSLKQRHHELSEQHAKAALQIAGDTTATYLQNNSAELEGFQDEGFDGWANENWGDFDNSLRLQKEVNHLRQEVTQLRADSQHWRSVAGQLSHHGEHSEEQVAQRDIFNLQAKVKELERKASEIREQAQHEVVSLQDMHQSKLATLKARHKEEIGRLKSQISLLEQQVTDAARDGDSTGPTGSSSVLPESERAESELEKSLRSQLLAALQERDKVQASQTHLQIALAELQREVEQLQTERDQLQGKISALEEMLEKQKEEHEQQITTLQAQLQEAERWRLEAEQNYQQVGMDLYLARHCLLDQLEANHADTTDLLSDVYCIRQQLSAEAAQRQRHLLAEKQNMATRLFAAGVEEAALKSGIVEAGRQLQQVSADTEHLIEQLGGDDAQQQAANMVDSLEREILVQKEQNVKLQEQITLLERRLISQQQDWQSSQDTIKLLKQELKQYHCVAESDSENTLDRSFTSGTNTRFGKQEYQSLEGEADAIDLPDQTEAMKEVLAQLRQQLREKDECISQLSYPGKEACSEEVMSLKEDKLRLQEQLSSTQETLSLLQDQKDELEVSIGELDEQHEEAISHLITARNTLQSQLTESQQQVKNLQETLANLSRQQDDPEPVSSTSEQLEQLKQELQHSQEELYSLRQQADSRESEVAELKSKLQKGTLALNDLHMDKKDLENELAKKQEEVKAKVALIRTLGEEKAKLIEENKDLSDQVHELEDELEAWEQRNENLHASRSEQQQHLEHVLGELSDTKACFQQLQQERYIASTAELAELEQERDRERQRLAELEQERDRERQRLAELEQERDRERQRLAELEQDRDKERQRLAELEQERDKERQRLAELEQERDRERQRLAELEQERDKERQRLAELEVQLAEVLGFRKEQENQESQLKEKILDLETQLTALNQQVGSLAEEKLALQKELKDIRWPVLIEDCVNMADLNIYNQHIIRALQRRNAALEKVRTNPGDWFRTADQSRQDLGHQFSQGEALSGQYLLFLELCTENKTVLEAVSSGSTLLDEIQQLCLASEHSDHVVPLTLNTTTGTQSSTGQDSSITSSHSHLAIMQAKNEQLSNLLVEKESVISDLRQALEELQHKSVLSADTVLAKLSSLETMLADKDRELEALHGETAQLMAVCEESKARSTDSELKIESLKCQLQDAENALQQLQAEQLKQNLAQASRQEALLSKVQAELDSARDKIVELETKLSDAEETMTRQRAGIEELNAKYAEQSRCLESEQENSTKLENMVALLHQNSLTADEQLKVVKSQLTRASSYLSTEQLSSVLEDRASLSSMPLPALEYIEQPILEVKTSGKVEDSVVQNELAEGQESGEEVRWSGSLHDLTRLVEEKERVIADLQQNNTALLQMLEAQSLVSPLSGSLQVDVHRLQSEVKALKVEKEQMLAIMNEKSRDASSLKTEVMRLMSVISAEKSALDKLQKENQQLVSRALPEDEDSLADMTREAMHNLSRLVRDREVEIEALKQKNETLMAVLQDMDQGKGDTSFTFHLSDKENLEKQLAVLQAEREQMVVFVNQKHAESVAYHAELQRLLALREEENKHFEQLQSDYDTLRPQFEDKNQSLLKLQNDLINYRQKYAELEVKYGELLQKSGASETVDAASYREVEDERERLILKQAELQQTLQDQEEKLRGVTDKLNEKEKALLSKESEVSSLRKQVDSLQFQLQGLKNETTYLKQEQEAAEDKKREQQSQWQQLMDLNNQLTLAVREKEFEVVSLQERVQQLTSLVSEQQGEKTQVTQLLKDQETTSSNVARLQQEVDQLTLSMKRRQQQLNELQDENLKLKEKEQKLLRELERLRGHLLQIEEGYTREALEAEEREKGLRNRLADAEEQLQSSAAQVHSSSQQASQQVDSLKQQLHNVAAQRDAAYMQVANFQEQCQQYASSLSNLQLVLEQFQRDKDSLVASETERYQEEARRLREKTVKLEKEVQEAKLELDQAADALAAASRLSEKLDHKEEALQVLREEVHKREDALKKAEDEIRKLTSNKEAKVERELMKNLLLGYFHTPSRNRMDAIHAIGSVLGFTPDDFHKIEESEGGGWMSNFFRRTHISGTPPSSIPVQRSKSPDQSFSQLFVKFLEVESTPPPAPVRLPAEKMAREAQQRHHIKERDRPEQPAFNPFTAPRHVAMPILVGSAAASAAASSSSHLLLSSPPGSPTTSFPVFSPFSTPQTSSAILKDVLGSR